MEFLKDAFEFAINIDRHLIAAVRELGPWSYAVMFASIFAETALVVAPFLPGDVLVFSAAALSAMPKSRLDPWLIAGVGAVGAITGDLVCYFIGHRWGSKLFRRKSGWLFTQEQKKQAGRYFDRYGGKTLILCRYIPLIRNAAIFMAGVGEMKPGQAARYIVISGIIWASFFSAGGYFLGQVKFFERNFHYTVLLISVVAAIPGVIEWIRFRRQQPAKRKKAA